jgi:hypothetical protein
MEPLTRIRLVLSRVLFLGLAATLGATTVRANELAAQIVPTTSRIIIHDADETLRDWCHMDEQGVLRLVLPGGASFELVTSTADPVITNHGDGDFHVFDPAEVRAALAAVRYPLDGVAADVFILPFPRRAGLASAAGPGVILLSPGVYPLRPEQQHAEFDHELGHVVQYARLPDRDDVSWGRYRSLRGITDASVYSDDAAHADRPHEIFAEDFRALFGGALATSTGNIENALLTPPAQVDGLADFLIALSGTSLTVSLGARPNPSYGPVVFSRKGSAAVALDLFDLAGRRLATLTPELGGGWVHWSWDGRDESGRRAAPSVVFARARDGGAPARVTLLP